jgi:hypothetical protein
MKSLRILAAIAVSFLVLAGCGGGSYTLKLNPKEGETYHYTMKMSGPQSVEMTMDMTARKVDAKQVVMDTKIGNLKIDGKAPPAIATAMFEKMVMTVTEDHLGHVLNTDVTGVPQAVADQMKSQGSGTQTAYPDKPVKVGDTWTGESRVQGKTMNISYKLASVSGDKAVLEATSDSKEMSMKGPMSVTIDLSSGMPTDVKYTAVANGKEMQVQMTRS